MHRLKNEIIRFVYSISISERVKNKKLIKKISNLLSHLDNFPLSGEVEKSLDRREDNTFRKDIL